MENHIGELHWRTGVEIQFSFSIWRLKPGEKGKMAEKEQFGDTFETTQWRKIKRQKGEMVEKEWKCRSRECVQESRMA